MAVTRRCHCFFLLVAALWQVSKRLVSVRVTIGGVGTGRQSIRHVSEQLVVQSNLTLHEAHHDIDPQGLLRNRCTAQLHDVWMASQASQDLRLLQHPPHIACHPESVSPLPDMVRCPIQRTPKRLQTAQNGTRYGFVMGRWH